MMVSIRMGTGSRGGGSDGSVAKLAARKGGGRTRMIAVDGRQPMTTSVIREPDSRFTVAYILRMQLHR